MSVFPRIDPQHVLSRSARETNDYAARWGLPATLEWIELDVSPGEFAYLAEQRALRAAVAREGVDLGELEMSEAVRVARETIASSFWQIAGSTLTAAYMDGIALGWHAHQLELESEEVQR